MVKYSQVFLNNKNIAQKIVNSFNSIVKNTNQTVIEIGPGKGVLTEFLLNHYKNFYAIEVDPRIVEYLKENFKNINIINQDFLKTDLNQFNDAYFIGNLPYHISTAILEKLIEYRDFKGGVFMLQKEVCEKIVATPQNKNYGYLTALINFNNRAEYLFNVSRHNFSPVPKVDSAVISIIPEEKHNYEEYIKFKKFISHAFRHKRKTLINSLKLSSNEYQKEQLIKIFEKFNINLNVRAEELDTEMLYRISKEINI